MSTLQLLLARLGSLHPNARKRPIRSTQTVGYRVAVARHCVLGHRSPEARYPVREPCAVVCFAEKNLTGTRGGEQVCSAAIVVPGAEKTLFNQLVTNTNHTSSALPHGPNPRKMSLRRDSPVDGKRRGGPASLETHGFRRSCSADFVQSPLLAVASARQRKREARRISVVLSRAARGLRVASGSFKLGVARNQQILGLAAFIVDLFRISVSLRGNSASYRGKKRNPGEPPRPRACGEEAN